jgi:hypothetical protein
MELGGAEGKTAAVCGEHEDGDYESEIKTTQMLIAGIKSRLKAMRDGIGAATRNVDAGGGARGGRGGGESSANEVRWAQMRWRRVLPERTEKTAGGDTAAVSTGDTPVRSPSLADKVATDWSEERCGEYSWCVWAGPAEMATAADELDRVVKAWVARRRELLSLAARQKMRDTMLKNFDGRMKVVVPTEAAVAAVATDDDLQAHTTPRAKARAAAKAATKAANKIAAAKSKEAALENRTELMRIVGQLGDVRAGYIAAVTLSAMPGTHSCAFSLSAPSPSSASASASFRPASASSASAASAVPARGARSKAKATSVPKRTKQRQRVIMPDDGPTHTPMRAPDLRVGTVIYVLFSDSMFGGSGAEPVWRWQEAVVKQRQPPQLAPGATDVSSMAVEIMSAGEDDTGQSARVAPLDAFMQARRRMSVLSLGWHRELAKTALSELMPAAKLPTECEYIISLGARADGKDFLWPFGKAGGRFFRKTKSSLEHQCMGELCWIRVADTAPGHEHYVGGFPLHGRTEPLGHIPGGL